MLWRKILPLSNLSLFESETIFSWKIISEREKYNFHVICGSMVDKNRCLPASAETPAHSFTIFRFSIFFS